MKPKILTQAIFILALLTATTGLYGQVTIGSTQPPVAGAILDLKEVGATTKGLAMPRVILTDKNKLYPMLANGYASTEEAKHVGLTVFHTDRCTMDGKGLYVWSGTVWNKIGELAGALKLSTNYIDFPSGHDARTLEAHDLTVTWPKGSSLATWSLDPAGALPYVPFTANPIPALTSSPQTISLLPDAMTAAEIAANPWTSKRSEYTFEYSDCGQTEKLVVEQVNHAIRHNRTIYYGDNYPIISTATTSVTLAVQSNVDWKATTEGTGTLAGSVATPSSALSESRDGTSLFTSTVVNTPVNGGARYDYVDITFMDQRSPKRAKDITYSITNCTTEPVTMTEWAVRAGFTAAQVNSIGAGGTHAITRPNGIQLHKDQNGNVFLSGDFGTAGRWMLNNLAATQYDSNVTHAHGRVMEEYIYASTPSPPAAAYWTYIQAHTNGKPSSWYYPYFNRLGVHYTWDTATAGKGGATDNDVIGGEMESAATPDVDPQVTRVQGICPNGWHLPSDWEWTQLEIEMSDNASKYSRMKDAPGSVSVGQTYQSRGTHGAVMMDPCNILCGNNSLSMYTTIGRSNPINATVAPGMNILMTGFPYSVTGIANFWTSSGIARSAVSRSFKYDLSTVSHGTLGRHLMFTVRCKKD